MRRIEKIYNYLTKVCNEQQTTQGIIMGVTAQEIGEQLNIQRTNVSSDLNLLCQSDKVEKVAGRPVFYKVRREYLANGGSTDYFDRIIGSKSSLSNAILQARAAIIYPPCGLHTLILGETGTGKSMLAESMYEYAKSIGRIKSSSPFVSFNCADYANNPQLLVSQLFGVKKGAYTGADKDREGLVDRADGGILFLDEIHRLPPEGQETLFCLIDKGVYSRLGESHVEHKVNVIIVCATTENIDSALLRTFTRRIPMVIYLPPLKQRTFEERYELIKSFFKIEAPSIKNDITVTANALKALMLYDCPNNIGQLRSDIKLCCAKAFLGYMMKRDETICVHTEDLPEYIRKGLLKDKEHRDELSKFIYGKSVKFTASDNSVEFSDNKSQFNFYDALEEKRRALEANGLSESDIKLVMSLDIETYLKRYLFNIENNNFEELYKVVDRKVVTIVSDFLNYASEALNKVYSTKILYGLSIHVSSSIERIISGKKIENHQLEEIKKNYEKEFMVSQNLRDKIQNYFKIKVPDDEVGFVTMFLCLDQDNNESEDRVGVVLAMHGDSTATSMADVVNRLLGEEYVVGYNMPLDQKPEMALENIMSIVKKVHKGKGVLMLVDMGSLLLFGDMIYQETGILVKTIEMVSTPIAIEAARKALMNCSIEEIYDSSINASPYLGKKYKEHYGEGFRDNVIITACITGEGTAIKLKSILQQKYNFNKLGIDIIPIAITSISEFRKKINTIKNNKNILAVVSAINPQDSSLLYISTADILDEKKSLVLMDKINMVSALKTINDMEDLLKENISIDIPKYLKCFKEFYIALVEGGINLSDEKLTGLILHLACAVERKYTNIKLKEKIHNLEFIEDYDERLQLIKRALKPMERSFEMEIAEEEYINIMMLVYSI